MNEYSDMNIVLGAMAFCFVLWAISKIGANTRQLPKKPEPLTEPNRGFTDTLPDASFDAAAFQNARNIIGGLERMPDMQAKTILLADALHKMEVHKARQTDRMTAAQQKEQDVFDKALALADRLSGNRQTPPPPPQFNPGYNPGREYYQDHRRINNYHDRGRIPQEPGPYFESDNRY